MTGESVDNAITPGGEPSLPSEVPAGPELLPPAVSEGTRESVEHLITKAEHVVDNRLMRLQERGIIDTDIGKRRQRILKLLETRRRH